MNTRSYNAEIAFSSDWDVIVVGGGPAGCTASAAAAREGAKVLLLERTGALGGMGTQGLVPSWCPLSDGKRMIYRGLALEVFENSLVLPASPDGLVNGIEPDSEKMYEQLFMPFNIPGVRDGIPIDCERLKRAYDNLIESFGVEVLFHSFVCDVEKKSDTELDAIIVANKRGLTAYQAKFFVDATGDGDIAAWSGADFEVGAENTRDIQPATFCFQLANVDSFYYRTLWRNCTYGWHPMSVNKDLVEDPEFPNIRDNHLCNNFQGPGVIGYNAGHLHADPLSPESLSRCMIAGRKLAYDFRTALAKHSPETFSSSLLVKTAELPGIRESRRIRGDYILTWRDYAERRTFEDEIGRNCYCIDIHGSNPEVEKIKEQCCYEKGESHGIPYRSLVPEKLDNLLVAGRCISVDRIVHGSTRIMPTCLVTGEAAGSAAALAVHSGRNAHNINVAELRKNLKQHGAFFN